MSDFPRRPPMPKLIKEKKSPRGLVPSSTYGAQDTVYNDFLQTIDPRNNEQARMSLATSNDKRIREFIRIVNLPPFNRYSLATCAKKLDISMPEFADIWRKSCLASAVALAANRLPEITDHIANDALSQSECCGRCDGWGHVKVSEEEMPPLEEGQPIPGGIRPMGAKWVRDCPKCGGSGQIRKAGDSHSRDKILQMTGFNAKGAGVTVAINNYGGMGIEAGGARMSSLTFDVSAEPSEGGDPEPVAAAEEIMNAEWEDPEV